MSYSTILYYKFFPVSDVELFRLWQWELCSRLGLKGRIIVSHQGINGTLGGTARALKEYRKCTAQYSAAGKIEVKWTHGVKEIPFPKLSVKARKELVTFEWDGLEVNNDGVINGGKHLTASGLQTLLEKVADRTGKNVDDILGSDVLFLDGRNTYEYRVGHFKTAINPEVANAKQFEPFIASGVLDEWKDKPIITYCTGGIRCEILSPLLKQYGFNEVYQMDGGIVRYLEQAQDENLWQGSVYTFDTRLKLWADGPVIGQCVHCNNADDSYHNCRQCGEQVIICEQDWQRFETCEKCIVA